MHGTVLAVHVIKGQPGSERFDGFQGPVVGVLMPGHGVPGTGFLDEEVGAPEKEVWTEQVFYIVEKERVQADIEEVLAGLVPFPDFLGGFTLLEKREELGEFFKAGTP